MPRPSGISDSSDPFTELIGRLERDRRAVRRLVGGSGSGPVTALVPGLSDPHGGGRTVWGILFQRGGRVIYKPRDGSAEAAFGRLVRWCTRHGATPGLRVPTLLTRPGYLWSEWVEARPPANPRERRQYQTRAGALLCLLDLLQARDIHRENIVSAGPDPVPVDLEMLLQPRRRPGPEPNDSDEAPLSVIRTGLLPYAKRTPDRRVIEPSALGADGSADLVERGFRSMYRFLQTSRDRLLAADGPLDPLFRAPVRVAIRDTATYVSLLRRPRRPNPPLLPAETRALRAGDIPWFHVRPGGTDLETAAGIVRSRWFAAPGIDRVRHRLRSLSAADLEQRIELIRANLAFGALWQALAGSVEPDGGGRDRARRTGRW
jgi:lantibiotic modifying enzyme